MASLGFETLYLYTDDVIYVSFSSEIHQAYSVLLDLLAKLGLDISTQPPISVICLGILVDTIAKTISIPSDKLSGI